MHEWQNPAGHDEASPTAESPNEETLELSAVLIPEKYLSNSRIKERINAVKNARKVLQEDMEDLDSRESSPEFQKAKELIDAGWTLTDRETFERQHRIFLRKPGEQQNEEFVYDPKDLWPEEFEAEFKLPAFLQERLGVSADLDATEFVRHFSNLTVEYGRVHSGGLPKNAPDQES